MEIETQWWVLRGIKFQELRLSYLVKVMEDVIYPALPSTAHS